MSDAPCPQMAEMEKKNPDADLMKEAKTMDLNGMQAMWPEMTPDTIKFIFGLFDADGDGRIDTQEFVMAVRLASTALPC